MISSILLNLHNEDSEGAEYPSHNGQMRKVTSTAYVDDVNTHHTSESGQTEELIQSMSRDYNRWKSKLESSGGRLASEKCSFYAIDWEFLGEDSL